MNVFSVGDGIPHYLTREEYMAQTHKESRFFRDPKKYKNPYFAICPECRNPIQIINLFVAKWEEKHTGKKTMHGRHVRMSIDGLAMYNQENYNVCPLHNPVAFGIEEIRKDKVLNSEIRGLIEENKKLLRNNIKEITGIFLKNERIDQMIYDYIKAGNYCYTHTNRFNIPYSILYTGKAISLYGQKIASSDIGESIKSAIMENSKYFDIKNGRIEKKIEKYVSINMEVSNHQIVNRKQYMEIFITEKANKEYRKVFQERILMKEYIYTR